MATVTILWISQDPATVESEAKQTAFVAVTDDNITYYSVSVGNIPEGADVQVYVDAIADDLLAQANLDGAPTMTHQEVITGSYFWLHWDNRQYFANALVALEIGVYGGVTPVGAYRTVISNTLAELMPLVGTAFQQNFDNERIAQGVNISVASMTLAQCAIMDNLLRSWLGARLDGVFWAQNFKGPA